MCGLGVPLAPLCSLGYADLAELPAVEGPFFLIGGLPISVLGLLWTTVLLIPRDRSLFLQAWVRGPAHPLSCSAHPQTQLIQMVVWMLQRRLLIQLHTYVCLMASPSEEEPRPREDDVPFTARVGGRSLSTPNALSFGSPSRIPFQDICLVMGAGRLWW